MRSAKLGAFVAIIAFVAAIAGVWIGRTFMPQRTQASELHEVLHHDLQLDARQKAQLEALEERFAVRRRAFEFELRTDNARLAEAIQAEHAIGPRVAAAVDSSHRAMGELQKETLAHIFAMRAILRPGQQAKFDQAVVHSLTADGR